MQDGGGHSHGVIPDGGLRRDKMRKLLLASVVALGTGGLIGTATAQAPAGPGRPPTQGQTAWTLGEPTAYVNNNNNLQAQTLPGGNANPSGRGRTEQRQR